MANTIDSQNNELHDGAIENLIEYNTIKFRLYDTYGKELVTSILKRVPIIGEDVVSLKILEQQMKKYS